MKLHSILAPILLVSVLSSCKDDPINLEPCCDVETPIEVVKDSIFTGSKFGVTIGESSEKVYADFQTYANANAHTHLNITKQSYSSLSQIKSAFSDYDALHLGTLDGNAEALHISFKDDKIASIQLSNGQKVNAWPNGFTTTVEVNDPVATVYDKLETISNRVNFAHLFRNISLDAKQVSSSYDEIIGNTDTWSFRYALQEDEFELVEFRFEDGKLASIYNEIQRY
ncbi:hypothetical protein [Sphingobacterium hungaricum]